MLEYGEITCYAEWICLEKKDFRILVMLADVGTFRGDLSAMCRYFSLDPQNKHRKQLAASIEFLAEQGYIDRVKKGRTYTLTVVPKEEAILVSRRWAAPIIKHQYQTTVAWEQVMRLYLWVCRNRKWLITNSQIAEELCVSESTVSSAKKVLDCELHAVRRNDEHVILPTGEIRTIGHQLYAVADWSE